MAAQFNRDRLAPKQFPKPAGGRRLELDLDFLGVAASGEEQRVIAALAVGGIVDEQSMESRFADKESDFNGRRLAVCSGGRV